MPTCDFDGDLLNTMEPASTLSKRVIARMFNNLSMAKKNKERKIKRRWRQLDKL